MMKVEMVLIVNGLDRMDHLVLIPYHARTLVLFDNGSDLCMNVLSRENA